MVVYTTNSSRSNVIHTLEIAYPVHYSYVLKDTLTHTTSIELYLRGVHCVQTNEHTLVFECARDFVYASCYVQPKTVN